MDGAGSRLAPSPAVTPIPAAAVAPVVAPGPETPVPVAAAPVALAARPPLALAFIALDPRPTAFRRIPSLAHRLQADLDLPGGSGLQLLDLDLQLVALTNGLLHGRQSLAPAELGDVDEPVEVRQHVHERAEGGGLHHGPFEPLPHFGHPGIHDLLDHLDGLLRALAVTRADEHAAVVFDVDVGAREGDDLVDPLALGTDDLADLVHGDLLHGHSWSLLRELR